MGDVSLVVFLCKFIVISLLVAGTNEFLAGAERAAPQPNTNAWWRCCVRLLGSHWLGHSGGWFSWFLFWIFFCLELLLFGKLCKVLTVMRYCLKFGWEAVISFGSCGFCEKAKTSWIKQIDYINTTLVQRDVTQNVHIECLWWILFYKAWETQDA